MLRSTRFGFLSGLILLLLLAGAAWADPSFNVFGSFEPVEALLDGDPQTTAGFNNAGEPVLYLAFEEVVSIESISLDVSSGEIQTVAVEKSEDIVNWSPAQNVSSSRQSGGEVVVMNGLSAQYLKLTIVSSHPEELVLGAVEVSLSGQKNQAVTAMSLVSTGERTATVKWETRYPTQSFVVYGKSLNALQAPEQFRMGERTEHELTLTGLEPGTEYRVVVLDPVSRSALPGQGDFFSFTTEGIPLPRIVGEGHAEIKAHSYEYAFTTNIPAKSWVDWQDETTGLAGRFPVSQSYTTQHSMVMSNLLSRRSYSYRILLADEQGREMRQLPNTITTAEVNAARGAYIVGTFNRLVRDPYMTGDTPAINRINDGMLDYFRGMAASGDPGAEEQWVLIDLREEVLLDEIALYWHSTACPLDYRVEVRPAGQEAEWIVLEEHLNAQNGEGGRSSTGDPLLINRVSVVEEPVQYLRLVIPKGSDYAAKYEVWKEVHLFEFKAFPREG